jgi:hypothetical protein
MNINLHVNYHCAFHQIHGKRKPLKLFIPPTPTKYGLVVDILNKSSMKIGENKLLCLFRADLNSVENIVEDACAFYTLSSFKPFLSY